MAYLELCTGHQAGKKFDLGNTFSLGRSPDNDLVLSDQRVSRYHARITRRGESFLLEDLDSSNGTLLRKKQLSPGIPSELLEGDEIEVGVIHLIFHLYRFISSSGEISRPDLWSPNPPRRSSQTS